MKFKKTALLLAVGALASASIAQLTTKDLTTDNTSTSLPDATKDVDNVNAHAVAPTEIVPEIATSSTTGPVGSTLQDAPTNVDAPKVATTSPVVQSAGAQSVALAPANITMPPPPPGAKAFVATESSSSATSTTQAAAALTPASAPASGNVQADKSGVAMSSDILFGFNGAGLTPESKIMLDRILPRLKAMDLEIVLATGHADRIGKGPTNERLSLQRAKAVKEYLVQNGIPANKIQVDGKGSKEPATSLADCETKKGIELRDCLAPDRRVNVVAQGLGAVTTMPSPDASGKATTNSTARIGTKMTFLVMFNGTSVKLTSTDNDLLDEIADAAMEADKVFLRGRSAIGDSEQRKARAIARGWAVRQALVFRGVEKDGIRVFYRTKGLNPTENNERVDVELFPKKNASE